MTDHGVAIQGTLDLLGDDGGVTVLAPAPSPRAGEAVTRASQFPRLRYMGSKYRLIPHLAEVFAEVGGVTALDAFSGSGVVSYLLKAQGFAVTANDFLTFASVIAAATVANDDVQLGPEDIELICSRPADDRDFISRTFRGLYFDEEDHRFLDSAWSHIDRMEGSRRALAISALVLSAARKQPRGVFTFTDRRYDDGRRDLKIPLRQHFRERAAEYNRVVFDNGRSNRSLCNDVFALDPAAYDLVYLDPPYAPPRDDNDYIKRYHFLEGLSVYWRGRDIMADTKTKKLAKRFTPFAYKRTIVEALHRTIERFSASTIVLSYSSNAVPDKDAIYRLMRRYKRDVEVRPIEHTYSFGTHAAAMRRAVSEFLFIGR